MLLNVSHIAKSYGPDVILEDVDFRLERREKVALVGRNGTGKTTLLKIIYGELEADTGSVQLARGAEIGYLKQHNPVDLTGTVREEAEKALAHSIQIKRRLEALEKRLDNNPTEEELEEYTTVHEHYLELEGYAAERDLNMVLNRMGFKDEDFDKPSSALSGGERTRLALARQILEEPDLLILDEPTNHLDLNAVEWLEGWLKNYPGAVLLVSHDRTFLDRVGDRFLELKNGKVKSYPGPFAKFLKLREEEDARQEIVAKRQQQHIDKLDEYVRRFMNSQRTAQARGRLKQMEKLVANRVMAPQKEAGMRGAIAPTKRSGDRVIEAKGLSMRFDDRTLFENLDWTVSIGERWGVIGDNGTGKSTLIRILLELKESTAGSSKLGANVEWGYFSQDADDLDPNESPLDFMVFELGLQPQQARDLLGKFLITGDDVFRPIKTLSGGERNKLALARLVHLKPNLLILDEPTNHLDMDSREALVEILREYSGTLILVSHDRFLLTESTNRTLHLRRDQSPISYPGSYADYRRKSTGQSPASKPVPKVSEAPKNEMSPRELSKEIQRVDKLVHELEIQISHLEIELQGIEQTLAILPPDADILALTQEHTAVKEAIDGAMSTWEEQSVRLEDLRSMQARS